MESEHSMRVGVCHTQAVACWMTNLQYTAGGRARIVYDALVDEILPRDGICYAFDPQNFFDIPYLRNGLR